MSKYQDRRKPKDQAVEMEEQLNYEFEEDKAQWESDIRATRKQLKDRERTLERVLSARPLESNAVVQAEGDIAASKLALEIMERTFKNEFVSE